MNCPLLSSAQNSQISTFLRVSAFFVLFASLGAPLWAQPQQSSVEARKARSVAHGKIVVSAKTLATQGDLDGAETALTTLSAAQSKTAQWHFELALNLTQLASNLAKSGDGTSVRPLVSRALRALNEADRLANDPNLRSGIYQHIGFLQDRFFGDKEAAKRAYRSAVQFTHEGKSAKERLDRMEETETNTRLKADAR